MPRSPRRPICSRYRCGRSPLPYYLPLANTPIDPNRLYDNVILGARPAASNVSLVTNRTRVRSTRHRRQSEALRGCDVVPILLAIDSLAVFNVIPRYAVLSNFPSASPRCHLSMLGLKVCSRRLAVSLRSHDYYRCERQNSDEGRSSQTVTSVHDNPPFQCCINRESRAQWGPREFQFARRELGLWPTDGSKPNGDVRAGDGPTCALAKPRSP
jgi:hypothetical protein